jgi:predicted  nucleic acid-binding Zn-ribbon protein
MPHQCVHCSKIYPTASKELLQGCSCGSHFFYFVRQEYIDTLKKETAQLSNEEKKEIEEDIREIIGVGGEEGDGEDMEIKPVVLDLESIRVPSPGKFEIDLVNLFRKKPLVYKLDDGRYVIDVASSFHFSGKKEKVKK